MLIVFNISDVSCLRYLLFSVVCVTKWCYEFMESFVINFLKQVVSCFYAVSNYFWELSDSRIRFTFRLAEFLLWFSGVQRVLNLKLLNTQVEVVFLGWVLLANVPSDTTNRDDNRVIWLTRFFILNDIDEISWRSCIKAIGKTRNISKYRHY